MKVLSAMYATGINYLLATTPPLFWGSLISSENAVDYRIGMKGTGCFRSYFNQVSFCLVGLLSLYEPITAFHSAGELLTHFPPLSPLCFLSHHFICLSSGIYLPVLKFPNL